MADSFLDAFDLVVGSSGWRTSTSPAQLLEQWQGFVDDCDDGYDWSIYEFDNELAVRDLIHRVLHAPELQSFPELGQLRERVDEVDAAFRSITYDDQLRGEGGVGS